MVTHSIMASLDAEDSGELETRRTTVHADMSVEDVSAFLREQVKLPDRFCEAFEGIQCHQLVRPLGPISFCLSSWYVFYIVWILVSYTFKTRKLAFTEV